VDPRVEFAEHLAELRRLVGNPSVTVLAGYPGVWGRPRLREVLQGKFQRAPNQLTDEEAGARCGGCLGGGGDVVAEAVEGA
jgi:hypothetical protein